MLNWDEYNKDEAAVVQQEAMTAKPVVQEAVAEVPEVKEKLQVLKLEQEQHKRSVTTKLRCRRRRQRAGCSWRKSGS